jgi:flagellar hook-associated protein 2
MGSIGSFSGVASGIQWRDMIDQIMAIEARPMDRLQASIDAARKRSSAWSDFSTRVQALRTAATAAAGTALRTNMVTLSGGTTIASASATSGAAAGTHTVRVLGMASAEALGSAVFTSRTTALGLSGEMVINGRRVEIQATDSLDRIATRLNDANVAGKLGATASVLSTAAGYKLVLSSTTTGAAGIDLVDGASGMLRSLGLLDDTTSIKHISSSGARSDVFAAATDSIANLIGFTAPGAGTVRLGSVDVVLDLATMSLDDVAAAINDAAATAGSAVTATVVVDGAGSRLDIRGTTSFTDDNRILEGLGILQGGRGAVAQAVRSSALSDGGGAASLNTSLTSLGAQANDTLTLSGTRGDGTTFSIEYTIGAGDTVETLLARLNSSVDGFQAGTRTATASIVDGRIVVTDDAGGDSRLALTIVAHNENGGTLDFGDFTTAAVGRARRITAAANAHVEVDGSFVTSASNTITDVIPGLTLRLGSADPATTMTVVVDRDVDAGVSAVRALVDTYNSLAAFVDSQLAPAVTSATAKPLHGDTLLRSMRTSLRSALNGVMDAAVTGGPVRLADIGMEIDRAGRYTLDADKLQAALQSNGEAVARLLGGTEGAASARGLAQRLGDVADSLLGRDAGSIKSMTERIGTTITRYEDRISTIELRLAIREDQLVKRFTALEAAMSLAQSQSAWLDAQLSQFQNSKK